MLFEAKHYVPILKCKEGELGSLRNLDPTVKAGLTPMLEVVPVPWDFENDQPQKMLDDHLNPIAEKVLKAWGNERPLFVDLRWIPEADTVADGRTAIAFVLDDARQVGLKMIPVTGFDRGATYQAAIKNAAARDRHGLCIRIERTDFNDLSQYRIDGLLQELGVAPPAADLIIDFRDVTTGQAPTLALAAQAIISNLPYVSEWRSLTVAGSAFPINLSGCPSNATSRTERTEWLLWSMLKKQSSTIPRLPAFGDYAIAHPDQPEDVDPRMMQMSANLRYTAGDDWLILKGRSVRQFGFEQFKDLCRTLVSLNEFSGRGFSWGDTYIDDCAANTDGPGNATTWRRVGTTHHFSVVTQQIASLPWP